MCLQIVDLPVYQHALRERGKEAPKEQHLHVLPGTNWLYCCYTAEAPRDSDEHERIIYQRREVDNRSRPPHGHGLTITGVPDRHTVDAKRDENRRYKEAEPHDKEEHDDCAIVVVNSTQTEEEEEAGRCDGQRKPQRHYFLEYCTISYGSA